MLALTRKIGERLVINDNIIITVIDVKGDNVRVAIEAPKEIKIYRGELYDAIVSENRQASGLGNIELLKELGRKAGKPDAGANS